MTSPAPQPCFVCGEPTDQIRSLSRITAKPHSKRDEVSICQECEQDWSASLRVILTIDLKQKPD